MMAPKMTVQRMPYRVAIGPIAMPPRPEPSQASAAASAGTERWLPASAAIALRPTETIHSPPNEKARQASATVATTHE